MLRITPRRWTSQPQFATGIDWSNPITRGLDADWNFALSGESITGAQTVRNATYSSGVVGGTGVALSVNGGGSTLGRAVLNCAGGADNIGSGDFTVMHRFVLKGSPTGYSAIGRWNSGASASTCDWFVGAGSTFTGATSDFTIAVGSTLYAASAAGAWVVGHEYTLVGRRRGTTIYISRFDHTTGVLVSGSTTNAGITTVNYNTGTRSLKLGEIDAGASYNVNIDSYTAKLWNRSISDAEIASLSANPWQIFSPALC